MSSRLNQKILHIRSILRSAFSESRVLAFLPALILVGFWFGGESLLLATALGFPICLALTRYLLPDHKSHDNAHLSLPDRRKFERELDSFLAVTQKSTKKSACFIIELDDFEMIQDRFGQTVFEDVMNRCTERLQAVIRTPDRIILLASNQIGIAIAPATHLNHEVGLQMATRFQAAIEEPIALGATTIYVSVSVGLCLNTHVAKASGKTLVDAASLALNEALRHAPSALRTYSPEMRAIQSCPHSITDEITQALENGQIQPWYQPQISTDTGRVTGFEALARWMHPDRGMISPPEFIPSLEAAGKIERLGEAMLAQALSALSSWDQQGLDVPHIGVNFAPDELRNPRLLEKVEWALDRFELTPDRLAVEILETVVATSPNDTVSRNINALSTLGCLIDLDDFGTGHASISSIRRFAVQRIKIDRSFVMKVDQDPEQQRMVSAILLMTERLGLASLAEGVETAGEHAMLAQLGCGHVQGFGIGRPMPFDASSAWILAHHAKLSDPPIIGRQTG